MAWIASMIGLFYSFPFFGYLFPENTAIPLIGTLNLLFLIGIPLVGLGLFIVRIIFGTRLKTKWRAGMGLFWGLNLVCLFFIGTRILQQFSSGTDTNQNINLSYLEKDTVDIRLGDDLYKHQLFYIGDNLQISEDELVSNDVFLRIKKAEGSEFELIQSNYARGSSIREATNLASSINLPITKGNGGITIPPNFTLNSGQKWRNQKVNLTLYIPANKVVKLDKSVTRILRSIDVEDRRITPWREEGKTWRMEEEGLVCVDCRPENASQFPEKDFTSLKIDGKMKVYIEQGNGYEVSLAGKSHFTEQVDVVKINNTLNVSTALKRTSSPIRVYITLPKLESIETENTDDVTIKGFEQKTMTLNVKGHHELKAYVNLDSLHISQSNRSKVDLRGNCTFLKADLNERAKLDAEKIKVKEADVTATDGSRASFETLAKLTKRTDERSKILVEENPSVVIQQQ